MRNVKSESWIEVASWVYSLPIFCITSIWFGIYCIILLIKDKFCTILFSKKVTGAEQWHTVIIGAGFSGLTMASRLKEIGVNFTIIEKAEEVGGTWWHNTYPGAACDIPSHLYSISFYPKPNWTKTFSMQEEILEYLKSFARHFDLYKHIRFNQKVTIVEWNRETQLWTIKTDQGLEYIANFVVSAPGPLHKPSIPNFTDMNTFDGPLFHTATWRKDVSLVGKRVAIIGTGATSVQIVPEIAETVGELYVFQRTAAWSPPKSLYDYSNWAKDVFTKFPFIMYGYRVFHFWFLELVFQLLFFEKRKVTSSYIRNGIEKRVRRKVKDPGIAAKLIPNFSMGCKRISPSIHYLKMFNLPNVHLVTDPISKFSTKGIEINKAIMESSDIKQDKHIDLDVVILATGFDPVGSFASAFEMGGDVTFNKNKELFQSAPTAYLGSCLNNVPNFFNILGPNSGLGHNTVLFMMECQVEFVIQAISQLIMTNKYKSMKIDWEGKTNSNYQRWIRDHMKDRPFAGSQCNAWYTNHRGENYTLWPGSLPQYWLATRTCSLADFILTE